MRTFDPVAAARFIADAHGKGDAFRNLPPDIAPANVTEAYEAQDALGQIWGPMFGPVAGRKIATTTKVMQAMMGIDHPCGGIIYDKRVHPSPVAIAIADFQHLVIECELAVRLGRDLPASGAPYTAATVRPAVAEVMAAFELIEDRRAVYKETSALTLIADNSWNGGVVLGAPLKVAADVELNGIHGTLKVNGTAKADGRTDGPMDALAWVANLAIERGQPMTAGMIVITGSLIPTLPIETGDAFSFAIEGVGVVEMTAR